MLTPVGRIHLCARVPYLRCDLNPISVDFGREEEEHPGKATDHGTARLPVYESSRCIPPALAMDQKGAGVDAGMIVVRPKVINFDQTPGVRVCTTWRSSDRGTRPDLKSNLSTGPHPGVLGLAAAWAFVFAARGCQPVFIEAVCTDVQSADRYPPFDLRDIRHS